MTTRAAVGKSYLNQSRDAGRAAATSALAGLDGHADQLLLFSTTGYDQHELLRGVTDAAGNVALIGCSGEGIIAQAESQETDYAVAVMAVRSDSMSFEPLLLGGYDEDPVTRGRELARSIGDRAGDALGLLLFPDGLVGNCTQLLQALEEHLPVPLLMAGGTSADAMVFERTYQFCGGEIASNSIAALLIRGEGYMDVSVSHGCAPIGLEREVTDAEGGWVREIDGSPAWEVFKEYLDGDPQSLNADGIVHLCVGQPLDPAQSEDYAPFVIRTPLRLDDRTGALYFPGGGLEQGQRIRLTRRDPARIKESARRCAQEILGRNRNQGPALVLQFDCAGRGKILFGSCAADEIVKPLQETLGLATPWIGFHTYGEIAPIGGRSYYHNYTVALCALYDVKSAG